MIDAKPSTADALIPSAETPFRLLVDAVEEYAIFMLDTRGQIVTWNPGAERIKGYAADEIVGRHFSVFYTAEDVLAGKPERELAVADEQGQARDEGWRVRKDGTRFWANVVITAIRDASGTLAGFAKVTRDETDRRNAEGQARLLEVLTDRERIAREMSETIMHRVFQAGLSIEGAVHLVSDPDAAQRIRDGVDMLDEILKEIRTMVFDVASEARAAR